MAFEVLQRVRVCNPGIDVQAPFYASKTFYWVLGAWSALFILCLTGASLSRGGGGIWVLPGIAGFLGGYLRLFLLRKRDLDIYRKVAAPTFDI